MDARLKQLLNIPKYRRHYMAMSFYRWCRFYFNHYYTFDTPEHARKTYEYMQDGDNVFMEEYRGSAKTTRMQMFATYNIDLQKRRHMMWYSDTGDASEDNLMYISNNLIENERLQTDYGQLYYDENAGKFSGKTTKGKKKFQTENDVMVVGMSLKMSPRGKNFTTKEGKFRPDLIFMDDIDTLRSVQNKKIIDKNWEFFLNEILGGTNQHTQFCISGNTIYEDGMIPRMAEHFKKDPKWKVIKQPIYDQMHKIVWNRFVETDGEADAINANIHDHHRKVTSLESERKRLGSISFGQNYELKPYIKGTQIVSRHLIQKLNMKTMEFDKIRIGIDTAISKKEESDNVSMTVTGWDKGKKYVLENITLQSTEKRLPNQVTTAKFLYKKWENKTNNIGLNVETVAFQEALEDALKDEKMATYPIKTSKDKITRSIETQGMFEAGLIFFNEDPQYAAGIDDLIDEIIAFPNGDKDDRWDSCMMSWEEDDAYTMEDIYV